MADKSISELGIARQMTDDALLPVYQSGETKSIEGSLIKQYARESTKQYVEGAKASAQAAEESAKAAQTAREGVEAFEEQAGASAAQAAESAAEAGRAAEVAERSKDAAGQSERNAGASAAAAAKSEANAALSHTGAVGAQNGAEGAKASAEAARSAAEEAKAAAEASSVKAASKAEDAEQSAVNADGFSVAAAESASAAAQAREAIEGLGVQGVTLAAGSQVKVEKLTAEDGTVTLKFSIPQGEGGEKGEPGVSIATIERTAGTGAAGTVDTYTITLSNGQKSTFQVYNGKDGEGSGDMSANVYDPTGKAKDVFAYTDQAEARAKAASRPSTWTPSAGDVGAVPIAGGMMTGPLTVPSLNVGGGSAHTSIDFHVDANVLTFHTPGGRHAPIIRLPGNPTDPRDAATKAYVDAAVTGGGQSSQSVTLIAERYAYQLFVDIGALEPGVCAVSSFYVIGGFDDWRCRIKNTLPDGIYSLSISSEVGGLLANEQLVGGQETVMNFNENIPRFCTLYVEIVKAGTTT